MKEYKLSDAKVIIEQGVDTLNKDAVEGWHVIQYIQYGHHCKLLLEREKPE